MEKSKIIIEIDNETGEYSLDIKYTRLGALRDVCEDIVERIDKGQFNRPELIVPESEEDELDEQLN